jgi:hypothetical protein
VLTAIKLLHTVIWAFLAATILLLPVAGRVAPIPLGGDPHRDRSVGVRRACCQWRKMPTV